MGQNDRFTQKLLNFPKQSMKLSFCNALNRWYRPRMTTPPNMISRIDALRTGRKRFYAGKPCIRGHFAERYTTSGSCVECQLSKPVQRCRSLLVGDLPPPRVAGRCDLCERPARLKRDFDRAMVERGFPTLECYRGWLCVSCKIGLSQIGDTPRALRKALRYVSGQLNSNLERQTDRKSTRFR